MTNVKRLAAVMLAFLMMISSMSVIGSAWSLSDDGTSLSIRSQILREVNGEWVESDKVVAGEDVKVRIYLGTDYYSGNCDLLFFYDNSFFTDSYTEGGESVTVNSYYANAPKYFSGYLYSETTGLYDRFQNDMIADGVLTQAQAEASNLITTAVVTLYGTNIMFDASQWVCEYDLKVLPTATGTGSFYVLPSTFCTPTAPESAFFNVDKGEGGIAPIQNKGMWLWNANVSYTNDSVSIMTNPVTVTFDAGTGSFANNETTATYEGDAGDALAAIAEPTKPGATFGGWATVPNPTADDVVAAPTVFPTADTTYYAYWEAGEDDLNNDLAINTRFFRYDEATDEWVETTRVRRGDRLKARLYLATGYYANAGQVLLFYDNDFFENDYVGVTNPVVMNPNPASSAAINSISADFVANNSVRNKVNEMVYEGLITQEFANQHDAFFFSYDFGTTGAPNAMLFDDSNYGVDDVVDNDLWFAEFELIVSESATGWGDLFVAPRTVQNTTDQEWGAITISRGTPDGDYSTAADMWLWDADVTLASQPVTLYSTVTFEANSGNYPTITDDPATTDINENVTYIVEGSIGDVIDQSAIPTPEKTGSTFMGWYDATIADPTLDDIIPVPTEIPYEDLVLNAYWQDEVTISFETYGGTEIADRVVTAGQPFEAVTDPVKPGYTFMGWSMTPGTTSGLSPITGLPAVNPAVDTTYYAAWEQTIYTLSYFVLDTNNNASLVGTATLEYGEVIPTSISSYTVPAGYVLSNWYWDVTCTDALPAGATMPGESTAVYARLSHDTVDAVFDANGGAFADSTTTKTVPTVMYTGIIAPEDPTWEGHTFVGWEPAVGLMDDPNGKTFYAAWIDTDYTATYYVEGEVYDAFTLHVGDELEVPADPYLEGQNFLYWSETEGGPEAALPAVMPAEALEYYAVFEAVDYTITYISEGAEYQVDTYNFEDAVTLPADPSYSTEFYSFVGWDWYEYNDETDAYDIAATQPETMPAVNLEAIAIYEPNTYDAVFDANGGLFDDDTAIKTIPTVYGEIIDGPENPTLEGYTFEGWTPEFVDGTSIMDEAGKTYLAVWTANPYTITYDPNGGQLDMSGVIYTTANPYTEEHLTDDVVAIIAEEPTLVGYVFGGWEWTKDADGSAIAAPAAMPGYDITATAIWTPAEDTEYTIETYVMDTVGVYPTAPTTTETRTGTTGDYVTIIPSPLEGFYVDTTSAEQDTILAGNILADGSLVLKVYYARNVCEITWDADGGYFNGDPAATDNIVENTYFGATIIAPPVEKVGYTFAGWTPTLVATVPNEATLYYTATWTVNEYTITYISEGAEYQDDTYDYDEAVTVIAGPTKYGYTFDSWTWTKAEDNSAETEPANMPAYDLIATAEFTPNEYPANYYYEVGSTDAENLYETVDIIFDELVTPPAVDPTKEGYIFAGWVDEDGAAVDFATEIMDTEGGENFFATWTAAAQTYVVNVYQMATDGTYPATPNTTATYNTVSDATETVTLVPAGVNTRITATDLVGGVDEEAIVSTFRTAWFTLDEANSVLTGVVPADGSGLVLDVYLSRNQFTLTTVVDEASDTAIYYYQQAVTPIADPVKEGYDFLGWSTVEGDATAITTIPTTMPAENLIFYAIFEINQYTITYDANDGVFADDSAEKTHTDDFGAPVPEAEEPTREGYTFTGWDIELPETMPAEDITATAQWEINTYTVTFDSTTGAFADATTEKTVDYDFEADVAEYEEAPTMTGYVFAGWADEDDNLVTFPFDMPASDITLYATWTADTVGFIVREHYTNVTNNTEVTVDKPQTGVADTNAYIVDAVPGAPEAGATYVLFSSLDQVLAGRYDIDPTNENNVLTGVIAADGSLVLHVYYVPKTYTVTFDPNGGAFPTIANDGDNYVYSDEYYQFIAEPSEEPERIGYTFEGWALSPDALPEDAFDFTATGAQNRLSTNRVFYAIWTLDSYTASFDADGGCFDGDPTVTVVTDEVPYGDPITAPENDPARDGYEFEGWANADDPTTVVEDYGTMDTDGEEFVAVWTALEYPITWDSNTGFFDDNGDAAYDAADDSLTKQTSAFFDDAIVAYAGDAPVKEGYDFLGWSADPAAVAPDASLGTMDTVGGETFYAVWSPATGLGYYLYVYEMDFNGAYPAIDAPTTIISFSDGTTGENRTVTYTAPTGFTLDTSSTDGTPEYSVLTGMIPATGSLILRAYLTRNQYTFTANFLDDANTVVEVDYYYGEGVADPGTPVKAGYEFIGWATVEGDASTIAPLPATMPAADVTVYAIFELSEFTATFDAGAGYFNNDPTDHIETVTVDSGSPYDKPVNPILEGYTFEGWSTDGGETTVDTWPQTMGTEDINYTAVWALNSYTVTYYVPVRDADINSPTYGTLTMNVADYAVFEGPYTVDYNASFAPAIVTADPEILYYNFLYWIDEDGNEVTAWPTTMPAEDLEYYAVFERVPVYLVPAEDSTTVLDRGEGYYGLASAFTNSTVDRTVTQTYDQYDPDSGNVWYIYGLPRRASAQRADQYWAVNGDGYYVVTPLFETNTPSRTPIGTGTIVDVYDRVTGELVESFTIVYFGDVNGDGDVSALDTTAMAVEIAYSTSWSRPNSTEFNSAKFMAADVRRDRTVSNIDSTTVRSIISNSFTISQTTAVLS